MKRYFITLLLLFSFVAIAKPVDARLNFGVVVGSEGEANKLQRSQVESLAGQLFDVLQEEVVVKELKDSATIIAWLGQYAAIDLALLSAADVKAYRGQFLLIGPLDPAGEINLVARQGVAAEVAQKAAALVQEKGFSPWRAGEEETSKDLLQTPLSKSTPEPDLTSDIATKADQAERTKLVLGIVPELEGVLSNVSLAEQLGAHLEQVFPVEIKVKEFTQADSFAEWFMRYRMVDLAVVPRFFAETRLGRDYVPIAEIVRAEGGEGRSELLIGRRGQNEALQNQLQAALLATQESEKGQQLLANLGIQSVNKFFDHHAAVLAPAPLIAPPAPETLVSTPEVIEPEVVEQQSLDESLPEPVVPVAPGILEIKEISVLTAPVFTDVPPEPAVPDLVPETPAPVEPPQVSGSPKAVKQQVIPEALPAVSAPAMVHVPESPDIPKSKEISGTAPPVVDDVAYPARPASPVVLPAPDIVEPEVLPEAEGVAEAGPVSPVFPVVPEIVVPVQKSSPVVESPPSLPPESTVTLVPLPERPAVVASPGIAESVSLPEEMTSPELPLEAAPAVIAEPIPKSEVEAVGELVVEIEEQPIVEEPIAVVEPLSAVAPGEESLEVVSGGDMRNEDIIALLGENAVAAVVAQPEIPQELRPPGIPVVRPGRIPEESQPIAEGLFLTSLPETSPRQVEPEPSQPPLPEIAPEPGTIYIMPFVGIMVPKEVNDRIFDQFVDAMIAQSKKLEMQFVILKGGLRSVSPQWLRMRKYVTGEIYAYVEEAGSTVIDLRAKARLTYHAPDQDAPIFSYMHPVSRLLDRDADEIEGERMRLADDIAEALIAEFLQALEG